MPATKAKSVSQQSHAPVILTQRVSIRRETGREQMQTSQVKIHPLQTLLTVQKHSQSPRGNDGTSGSQGAEEE